MEVHRHCDRRISGSRSDRLDAERIPLAVLLVLPALCLSADLLSLHYMTRIHVIAGFLRRQHNEYELYVRDVRNELHRKHYGRGIYKWLNPRYGPFVYEASALHGSSIVVNIAVLLAPAYITLPEWWRWSIVSGLAGIVLTVFVVLVFAPVRAHRANRSWPAVPRRLGDQRVVISLEGIYELGRLGTSTYDQRLWTIFLHMSGEVFFDLYV